MTRFARGLVLAAVQASVPSGLVAQELVQLDIERANAFAGSFAVPESPAFALLSIEGDAILRPSTVQELATNLGDFTGSGLQLALPREVGLELSPGLLIAGRDLSLDEYRRAAPWYRTRISFATKRPDSAAAPTELAYGLRVTFLDRTDLRTNADYVEAIERVHLDRLRQISDTQDALVGMGLGPLVASELADSLATIGDRAAFLDGLPDLLESAGVPGPLRSAVTELLTTVEIDRARLERLRGSFENTAWNATSFDVALGGKASAADSTGSGLSATAWQAWATLALGVGSTGQVLIGGALDTVRDDVDDAWDGGASLATRLYVGSNRVKVLAEGEIEWREGRTWFVRAGAEARPTFGGWVQLKAGLKGGEGVDRPALVTDFSYNLGLQHLLNAFR